MDQAAYARARDAASTLLIGYWLAYCTQPDEELLRRFNHLQRQAEAAAVHAQELNYAAAIHQLPNTTTVYNLPPWLAN